MASGCQPQAVESKSVSVKGHTCTGVIQKSCVQQHRACFYVIIKCKLERSHRARTRGGRTTRDVTEQPKDQTQTLQPETPIPGTALLVKRISGSFMVPDHRHLEGTYRVQGRSQLLRKRNREDTEDLIEGLLIEDQGSAPCLDLKGAVRHLHKCFRAMDLVITFHSHIWKPLPSTP